jgi:hypothetical protein
VYPWAEPLEDRTLPQATLYIDYGDRFPNGVLADKVGRFDGGTSASTHVVLGPTITDPSTGKPFSADTDFTLTNFNAVYGADSTADRAKILQIVQRAYEPLDVRVVELTPQFQLVNGHQVREAASLDEVAATLQANNGDPRHNDAYVLVGLMQIGADNYNPHDDEIGIASGKDIPDKYSPTSNGNQNDGLAFAFLSLKHPDVIGRLATSAIAHESGHLFGMRHGPTSNPTSPIQPEVALAQTDIMSYERDYPWNYTGFFSRYPMVAGNQPDAGHPFDYNYLEAASRPAPAAPVVTPFDQLATDPEVGANPALEYITGTGANNVITIGPDLSDPTKAVVSVEAYFDADSSFNFSNPITVPGSGGGTHSTNTPSTSTRTG